MAGDTLSLTTIVFVRHFEKEIPLTINHGREMSTISGNVHPDSELQVKSMSLPPNNTEQSSLPTP